MRFIFLSTLLWIFRFILLLWFLAVLLWLRRLRWLEKWACVEEKQADQLHLLQIAVIAVQIASWHAGSWSYAESSPVVKNLINQLSGSLVCRCCHVIIQNFTWKNLFSSVIWWLSLSKTPFLFFGGGGFPPANQNLPLLGLSVCVLYLTKHYCRHSGSRRVSCLFTLPYFVTKFPLSATPLGSYLTIEISLLPTIMF